MKKITLLIAFFLAIVTGSYGQGPIGTYAFSESTEAYTAVSGTNSTATGDDGTQAAIPIGFTFNFDGVNYTTFGICTNGWVKLGSAAIGTGNWTNSLSNSQAFNPLIAAFWDDNHRNTGSIQYVLSGVSPNQTLEIGFNNVNIGGGGSTSGVNLASYKVRLYETTNVIEVVYGPTMAAAGALSGSVGLNGSASFLSVTPAASSTASSSVANNAISSTTNLVGKKYIFTPPVVCSGTPTGGTVSPTNLVLNPGQLPGNIVGSGYSSGVTGLTFQWEESTDGFASAVDAVGGSGATTTTYTPPAYNGTPKEYRLKVTCSGNSGYSTTCALVSCPAVSAFPWTENFDGLAVVGTTSFPGCWTKENGDWTTTNNASSTADADARSGTQFLRDSWTATNEYIWTQGFQLTAGTSYDFSFYWAGDTFSGWTGDVFQNTLPSSVGATQIGASFVAAGTTTTFSYAKSINTFVPSSDGIYYFAIRVNQPSSTPNYLSFDDFSLEVTPTCPSPLSSIASNLTSSSADLNWTPGGSEGAWNIEYGPTGFVQGTGTMVLGEINPTYTPTGLSANTTYQYYVQADCGAGDTSTWSGPYSFTTYCDAVATFTENFDGVTVPAFPTCWAKVGATGTTNTQTANNNSAPNTVYLYSSSAANKAVLRTVPVSNLGDGTHWLKFKMRASGTVGGIVEIGYLTDPASDASFVSLGSVTASTLTYEDFSFAPPAGSYSNYLALRHTGAPANSVLIDDVIWEAVPNCINPTGLTAGNFTSSSADFNWIPGGSEGLWNIEYGPTGFTQGTGTIINGEINPTYTATGLSANTTYQYYVQADCSGSTSTWSGPLSFTTACNAVTTLPHLESFDAVTNPNCWSTSLLTGTTNWTPDTDNDGVSGPRSGANFAGLTWTSSDQDALLTSPAYNLSAYPTDQVRLNVWIFRGNNGLATDKTTFYVNNTNSVTGATELLDISVLKSVAPAVATAGWYNYIADIPMSFNTGGDFYIIARGRTTGSFSSYSVGFDDYALELAPLCPVPTGLTASSSTNSADLNWTPGGSEGLWNVEYGPTGFTQGTGTMVLGEINPTYTATGLSANTTYQYYVQADCGGGSGTSVWAGPFSFTTTCTATNIPYVQDFESVTTPALPVCTSVINDGTGNIWRTASNPGYGFTTKVLNYPYNGSNPANTWFFTQGINLTAGISYRITYNYGCNSTTYTEKLKVAYGTSASGAGMTELIADHPSINQQAIQSNTVDFTPVADGVYYFGFQAYSITDQNNLYVDNINIDLTSLSTTTFDASAFKAYPNPVKDILNLSYSKEISTVSVHNLLGQEVMSKEVNSTQSQINLSSLSSGTYLVKVTVDGLVKTLKVVKE